MSYPVLFCIGVFATITVACMPKQKKSSATNPKDEIGLTVVRHVQKDSLATESDTLLSNTRLDCSVCPVDMYFCRDSLRVPLILPAGGFARNKAQEKECNWDIYPASVRCCTYDSLGNVIAMSINGSGTTQEWKYAYDDRGRIVECKGWWSVCRAEYDDEGQLTRVTTEHDGRREAFDFVYTQ